jgi:N-acetylneuraminic acid mutarotase
MIVEYDPSNDLIINMTSRLPTIREKFSCVEHSITHKIYCIGGYHLEYVCTQWGIDGCIAGYGVEHSSDEVLEYDPINDNLVVRAHLPEPRYDHSCVWDPDSYNIYCFGGYVKKGDSAEPSDEIIEYNPHLNSVITMGSRLPNVRHSMSCAMNSLTAKAYCFGGKEEGLFSDDYKDIIEYDITTDSVRIMSSMFWSENISDLSCVENPVTSNIYCIGGWAKIGGNPNIYSPMIYEYNSSIDRLWKMQARLPLGRYGHACAIDSSNGRIYCFGGSRDWIYFKEIIEYVPPPS